MQETIQFKKGSEQLVRLTKIAGRQLRVLLDSKGHSGGALRLAVIGGGCSGLQYRMELTDGPNDRDILIESAGARIVVDPKTALFVSGSVIDFSSDLQKGGFRVGNPNATSHCSCGESFSV